MLTSVKPKSTKKKHLRLSVKVWYGYNLVHYQSCPRAKREITLALIGFIEKVLFELHSEWLGLQNEEQEFFQTNATAIVQIQTVELTE